MDNVILERARSEIGMLSLAEEYKGLNYKENFKSHISSLINTANDLKEGGVSVLKKKRLHFTKRLHWELETFVLENSEREIDDDFLNELDNVEDELRTRIKLDLGVFYDRRDDAVNDLIEHTTNSFILSKRFTPTANRLNILNPWESSCEILTSKHILHTFSKDLNYVRNVIGFRVEDNDSKEIEGSKLILIGKGHKKNFSKSTVRDLYGLRGHVFNLIKENAESSAEPVNSVEIIEILRRQGVTEDELTDDQIKNWLISPLKRAGKIGSSKGGYFELKTCEDLKVTYDSHFENFKGFLHSIENYRHIALKSECPLNRFGANDFESHIEEMRRVIERFDQNN